MTYAATADDAVDPAPAVSCAPASGSDVRAGHHAGHLHGHGRAAATRRKAASRCVVAVSWSNLLAPIDLLGVAAFLRGLPVAGAVRADREQRRDHQPRRARLFVAPVDAAGNVGAERPAVGLAPGSATFPLRPAGRASTSCP